MEGVFTLTHIVPPLYYPDIDPASCASNHVERVQEFCIRAFCKIAFISGWIASYQWQTLYGVLNTSKWYACTDKKGNLAVRSTLLTLPLAVLSYTRNQTMIDQTSKVFSSTEWGFNH